MKTRNDLELNGVSLFSNFNGFLTKRTSSHLLKRKVELIMQPKNRAAIHIFLIHQYIDLNLIFLQVTAYSPTSRPLGCPVSEENGTFYASFQPEEAGEWKIHVTYDGQDIEHSPFKCMVFNPRAIFVSDYP